MRQQLCLKNLAVHMFALTCSNAGEVCLFQIACVVPLLQGCGRSGELKRSPVQYRHIVATFTDIR
jgi:hypothetical protein